jgi:hypothetical protein
MSFGRVLAAALLVIVTVVSSAAIAAGSASTHNRIPVLGYRHFLGHFDKANGWGVATPKVVDNEGDDSSFVYDLNWRGWGQATAYGAGKRHAFKPHGGNYTHGVRDELRASDLGMCHGRLAYRKLYSRQAKRPGGPMTHWRTWTVQHHGRICGTFAHLM